MGLQSNTKKKADQQQPTLVLMVKTGGIGTPRNNNQQKSKTNTYQNRSENGAPGLLVNAKTVSGQKCTYFFLSHNWRGPREFENPVMHRKAEGKNKSNKMDYQSNLALG